MKIQDRDIGTQRRTNNTTKEVGTKIKPHKWCDNWSIYITEDKSTSMKDKFWHVELSVIEKKKSFKWLERERCGSLPNWSIVHIFGGHIKENRTIRTENRLKDIHQEKNLWNEKEKNPLFSEVKVNFDSIKIGSDLLILWHLCINFLDL